MERFIDPKTLARVKDMPLVARTVADGFLHGIQSSHQRGVGIEFSQYRSYEPGDEPGRIDWKLFARSDRYFIREADRESEIATWFLIDCSQSMAQVSQDGAWSKFDYGRYLLATLSWIAQKQGDLAGMLCLNSSIQDLLPPATGERQWHRILKQLHQIKTGNHFPDAEQLYPFLSRLQVPGLVIVISDFHQAGDEIFSFIRKLATSRNEVVALQLQCADERNFPYTGPIRFEDLETGEEVLVSSSMARGPYLDALNSYQLRLQQALSRINVSLEVIDVDEPMDAALHAFMDRRRRQVR